MQTFQTAAVVGLIDNMSGPLKELSKQAKQLAQSFQGGKFLDPNSFNAYAAGLNRANAAAREHISLLSRINGAARIAGRSAIPFAAPVVPFVKKNLPEEKTTQDTLSRMRDLNNVDRENVDALRDRSRTEGVKYTGGPGAYLKEGESAAKMNIPPALLEAAAGIGQQFADFLKEAAGEGIEKTINTAEYFGMLKNRAGEKTSPKALFEEHLANGMPEADAKLDIQRRLKAAAGMYKRIANMMPGSEKELFEALKMSAPTAESLGVPLSDSVATLSMLATGGLTGSHAGTLYRGMLTRGGNPSFVAMAAARTAGYDIRSNMKLNNNFLNADNFIDGLSQYYGPKLNSDPKLKERLKKRINDFKADPNSYTQDGDGNFVAYNKLQKEMTADVVGAYGKNKKGDDAVNSELVSKRIAKGLNLSNSGFSLLDLIADVKKAGLLTPGFIKALVGTEAGTGMSQIGMQDIETARRIAAETTNGDKYSLSKEWDDAMKARAESVYGTWESLSNRIKALFDKQFEAVEQPLDAAGKKLNNQLDSVIGADNGKTRAGIAAGGGLAMLGGAGAASFFGGGALAAGLTTGLATGGTSLLAGAAAYMLYRGLTDPDTVKEGSVEDIKRRRQFGTMRWGGASDPQNEPWVTPRWQAPEWPTNGTSGVPFSDAKGGAASKAVEVSGTVSGSAELHQAITLTLNPSPYFETLVRRAESVSTMGLNGRLGTSMQGPGDNGTKPAGLTGVQ